MLVFVILRDIILIVLHYLSDIYQDPDPLDPQDFGFLDPDTDPQKYADTRIQIQGVKFPPKTAKKNFFTPKTQI